MGVNDLANFGISTNDLHAIVQQWAGTPATNSNQLYGDPSTWRGQYPTPQAQAPAPAPAPTAAAPQTAPAAQTPPPANTNEQIPYWQQQLETQMAMEQFTEAERGVPQGKSLPSAEEMWAKMQTPRAPQMTGDPYAKQDVPKDPRNENNPPSE